MLISPRPIQKQSFLHPLAKSPLTVLLGFPSRGAARCAPRPQLQSVLQSWVARQRHHFQPRNATCLVQQV